ncbi:nuclease-related domain-containing protein [Paenibacillus xylanexedens]|uniref:nuclease-related domain-containing protein n=1 Tax=Paenibacillus xylanexedens TaxID=528191 RepID=UPI0011A063A5|nr:nuclease-related domain-containing protein [Paenibacillus xylanexedens]
MKISEAYPVEIFATYSDLFGVKYEKERLQGIIHDLPLGGMINVLSKLSGDEINEKNIRAEFITFLRDNITNSEFIIQKVEGMKLHTPQGFLTLWKWFLSYGDWNKLDDFFHETNRSISTNLYLHLIVGDYLYEKNNEDDEDKILYEMFSNLNFNSHEDIASALSRACVIYDEIAKNEDNFSDREYMDINEAFQEKYNYSIKEYLACLFSIFSSFEMAKNDMTKSSALGIDYFRQFIDHVKIDIIIDELSVDTDTAKKWATENIENSWNYQLFKEKPLIKLDNGYYLPFSLKLLRQQIFSQFFFKIRECFPRDNEQIISFIGRCFEKYVDLITDEALSLSHIDYKPIPEFTFGNNRSPDYMIRLGKKLLAVEVKNRRLKLDSIINRNQETIHSDMKNMIESPILQVYKCVKKLIERNHSSVAGIEEIYLVVVTQGSIATLPNFMKDIEERVFEGVEIPVKSIHHFDIQEYENMLAIIGKRGARPIFRILDNKTKLAPYISFNNYLYKSFYSKKRLPLINQKFNQYTDEFLDILTGKQISGR